MLRIELRGAGFWTRQSSSMVDTWESVGGGGDLAVFLKGILSMLTNLMFTEADRLKAHVELIEDKNDAEEAVLTLADYTSALGMDTDD